MTDRIRTLFPTEAGEFVFRDPDGNEIMRVPWDPNPVPMQYEVPPGVTESALKRGTLNTAASFANTGGLIAETLGADEYAQSFYSKADEFANRAHKYEPTIGRVENVKSLGDAGVFAWEVLLENAPILASMVVPGGAVSKGVQLLGGSKKAAGVAGATAAFLSDVGIQTGESTEIAREAGQSPQDIRVVGSGLGKAALDFVPLLAIAKRLGIAKNVPLADKLEKAIFGELAQRGYIARAARAGAAIAAVEVPTEVAQEVMNISLERALKEAGGDYTPEEKSQLLNAAAGAGVFALLGLPAGIRRPEPEAQPDDTTPEGVDKSDENLVDEPDDVDGGGGEGVNFVRIPKEGEYIPADGEPDIVIEAAPLALPDPTKRLQDGRTAEFIYQDRLEDQSTPVAPETAYHIGMDGEMGTARSSDPMTQRVENSGPIGIGLNLTAEQAEVASAYPEYLDAEPGSAEAQNIAGLHPGLQKLLDMKAEIETDEDNFRTTDGQMKKAAEAKLKNIETKIAKMQAALGIDPTNYRAVEPTPENMQPAPKKEPEAEQLSSAQAIELEELSTKLDFEGLSEREQRRYNHLLEVAAGIAPKAKTRAQTEAELKEIEEAQKETLESEYTRVRLDVDTENVAGKGMSNEEAQGILRKVASKFQFGPKVRLLDRMHPEVVAMMHNTKKEMRGWWDPKRPGEIVIVPSNHFDEKRLTQTYLHETLTHYGLGSIMTRDERVAFLKSLLQNPPQGFDVESLKQRVENGELINGLIQAEEYVARVAEQASIDPNTGLVKQSWWKQFIAKFRRMLRRMFPNLKWTDNEITNVLRDVSKMLTGEITQSNWPDFGRDFMREPMAAVVGEDVASLVNRNVNSAMNVWGARFAKWFYTPLQMAEQYNVPGSREFLEWVQQWWARKRILTDGPAVLVDKFQWFDKRSQQKLSQAILEISIKSDELERRLTNTELQEIFKEIGIDQDQALLDMWKEMDKSFQEVVQQLRHGLQLTAIRLGKGGRNLTRASAEALLDGWEKAKRSGRKATLEFLQRFDADTLIRLNEIDQEMAQLTNRNYFPRMRFGNWAITIRANKDMTYEGKTFKGPKGGNRGEVVYFETFETQKAQEKAWNDLVKRHPKQSYEMQMSRLSDAEFHFMGSMSPQLYEKLLRGLPTPVGQTETELVAQVKEQLRETYLKQAPGRSFLRHLTQRKGIEGYSEDVLRVYSSYMMNVANHIARVEYHIDMGNELEKIRAHASNATPDARIAGIISEYFENHYSYLMNPENDLAQLRAMGFLWYLGANVKSAAVNLTQVPMVAYPYLASKHGDLQASAALMSALKLVTKRKDGHLLDPEMRKQVDRAVREGFVDESRATELAGLAEQDVLQRVMPNSKTGRMTARASYYGAWLFQKAERINREVTFIAAFKLAKDKNMSDEAAFIEGRKAVQTAMFEYAKWNRPQFMRGKKSVFFLFWQYMQGLSYMAFGGAGSGAAMRTWMMLLLAGGLQGLPFAENIFDILDFVGTKSKEKLGLKDPRVDLRADLRELALELTNHPDIVMHGLSRSYGLGPLHLLQMTGLPVPNVDISGSISAGRVIPGTDDFLSAERDPSAKLGRTLVDIAGPVAGIPYQIWRAATDTNPDTWKVWERTLPVAFKNMSAAMRRMGRREESYRGGGAVAEFNPQDMEHRAELLAGFFGFAPTRLNQRYEADFSVNNVKRYWTIRRALVMENVGFAFLSKDPEAIKDARDAMHRFNRSVPDPALRVKGDQLQQSLKQRFRRASLRERGIPSERLYQRIVAAMRDLYPEAAVDIESGSQR